MKGVPYAQMPEKMRRIYAQRTRADRSFSPGAMPDLLDIAENAAVQRVDPAARDRSVRIAQRSDARSNALQLHELVVMARHRHLITVLGTS